MNGNCHLIFGTATGITTALILSPDMVTTTALISTCLLGSLFPDIDNEKSHIGQLTVPVSTVINEISKTFGKTGKNHRGIFHDMGVYIIGLCVSIYFQIPVYGFFIGALSHLVLDAFTPAGIPLFMIKKIHLGKFPSGGKASIILTWALSLLCLGIGVFYEYL